MVGCRQMSEKKCCKLYGTSKSVDLCSPGPINHKEKMASASRQRPSRSAPAATSSPLDFETTWAIKVMNHGLHLFKKNNIIMYRLNPLSMRLRTLEGSRSCQFTNDYASCAQTELSHHVIINPKSVPDRRYWRHRLTDARTLAVHKYANPRPVSSSSTSRQIQSASRRRGSCR